MTPIIKSFREEFYTEFEIIDVDAGMNPFNTRQILPLDTYLDSVDNKFARRSRNQRRYSFIT